MAVSTSEILLKVTADARAAIAGLKPLSASLDAVASDAKQADAALDSIGGGTKRINVNDSEVKAAQAEIRRLRESMREALRMDVNADTRLARKQIAQLKSTIRTLEAEPAVIPVQLDTRQLKQAEGEAQGLAARTSQVAGSIKGTVAVIAGAEVGKFFVDGAKGAATFETNMRSLQAVLGETVRTDVQGWIADNAQALNLSNEAAGELARSLSIAALSFQKAGGDASEFLTSLEEIAAQSAAFAGAKPGEAAEALGAAFRGEFDSLERFGINLNQATIEAQAMKDGLVTTAAEMTPAIKTQATYNAILEKSGPLMGSVARNADTMTGSWNQLSTSVTNLSTDLGKTLGPALADAATLTDEIVKNLDAGITKWDELRNKITEDGQAAKDNESNWHDFADFLTGSLPNMAKVWKRSWDNLWDDDNQKKADDAKAAVQDVADTATHSSTAVDHLAAEVTALAQAEADAASETEGHVISMKHLNDRVQSTADAFAELLANFTATNDAMIEARTGVYNYEGALDDLADSLKKNGDSFTPDTEQGRTNWDRLVGVATAASARVTNALKNRGADAADAVFQSSRDALHKMLTDAGVESGKAWALVDQVLKQPHDMKVRLDKADLKRIDADLEKLRKKKRKLEEEFAQQTAAPISAERAERLGVDTAKKIKPLQVQLNADLKNKQEANQELADIASPRGKPRKAQITAEVSQPSIDQANTDLDNLIKLRRTAEVQVHLVPPSTPLLGGLDIRSGIALGGTTVPRTPGPASPRAAEEAIPRGPQRAPRIQVLIDGEEVATHLQRRARQHSTTGGRRNP